MKIKTLFLYLNLCLSVMLNSLSYLFTSISFLTNVYGQSETRRVSRLKQEPLTPPEHPISPLVVSEIHVAQSFVF